MLDRTPRGYGMLQWARFGTSATRLGENGEVCWTGWLVISKSSVQYLHMQQAKHCEQTQPPHVCKVLLSKEAYFWCIDKLNCVPGSRAASFPVQSTADTAICREERPSPSPPAYAGDHIANSEPRRKTISPRCANLLGLTSSPILGSTIARVSTASLPQFLPRPSACSLVSAPHPTTPTPTNATMFSLPLVATPASVAPLTTPPQLVGSSNNCGDASTPASRPAAANSVNC